MATNVFSVRCKTQNGLFTLTELTGDCTVEKLKLCLEKHTQKKPKTMKILSGYPPKALSADSDNLKLFEVNIHSGDTIIMESVPEPVVLNSVPVVPSVVPVVPSAVPVVPSAVPVVPSPPGGRVIEEITIHDQDDQPGIMMRQVVPSNNSCLFTSMYFLLVDGTIDEKRCNELRNVIVTVVENNPAKFNEAVLGMPNGDYCRWILDTNHWGGAIELAILSEHFNIEIVAVDTINLKLHRFGETQNFKNRVFLIYDGIHYDPLLMELGNNKQTIFPIDDPRPMEMAMEIAKEAKSSRQFTDVTHFSVECYVCHVLLRGDKEARLHAKETGHCEFGEILV